MGQSTPAVAAADKPTPAGAALELSGGRAAGAAEGDHAAGGSAVASVGADRPLLVSYVQPPSCPPGMVV
eukprot:5682805-Alexandrium_andersonii.AAC.1